MDQLGKLETNMVLLLFMPIGTILIGLRAKLGSNGTNWCRDIKQNDDGIHTSILPVKYNCLIATLISTITCQPLGNDHTGTDS